MHGGALRSAHTSQFGPRATLWTLLRCLALFVCALPTGGCCCYTGLKIDPNGKCLLTSEPRAFKQDPGCRKPWDDATLTVTPAKVVAPVGSEVVVVGTVCGNDGFTHVGERVEWMLPPGGVGQFVDFSQASHFGQLVSGPNRARKIDNTYVISKALRQYTALTRGTPAVVDDVRVNRGSAWVSVTSPVEGTSHVTAYAPDVYGWDQRQKTAVIHWLNARWTFPPSASNPVGTKHLMTTSVVRATDGAPVAGYRVRYEIQDGPPAGFAPDGGTMIEVPTDAVGQARAELVQLQATPGVNRINVQVIRPEDLITGGGERLIVAQGSATKTWTSGEADLAVRMTGPTEIAPGSNVTYRVNVTNSSVRPAGQVSISNPIPPGMTFVSSNPPVSPVGNRIEYRLPELQSGQTEQLEFTLRADQPGSMTNCTTARAADGRTATDCVTTTVVASALDVRINGPREALVGEEVTFEVQVTNRGNQPAQGLVVVDRFDTGLEHQISASPIERDLETIPPGQTRRVAVTFRVRQPGRLCNRAEIRGGGVVRGTAEACVDAFEAQRGQRANLAVRKSGPTRAVAGGKAEFLIDVTNNGPGPVTNLRITDTYDPSLEPIEATDGYTTSAGSIVWGIDRLPVGKTVRLQVNCRCRQAAGRACNRVMVTTAEGSRADDEICVEISPASGGLELVVTDLRDSVQVGRELTYEIVVRNTRRTPDQRIALTVTAPPEMTPVRIGTGGPQETQFTIDGRTIRFEPVREMRAGESLRYEVRMRAERPGEVRLRAVLSSAGSVTPIVQEETTTIVQ